MRRKNVIGLHMKGGTFPPHGKVIRGRGVVTPLNFSTCKGKPLYLMIFAHKATGFLLYYILYYRQLQVFR